jgi:hypothetical protein
MFCDNKKALQLLLLQARLATPNMPVLSIIFRHELFLFKLLLCENLKNEGPGSTERVMLRRGGFTGRYSQT